MAKKFSSSINSSTVFEVLSAADGAWAQLRLLNGLTVKELRELAKGLGIKLTSGLRRKFNIEVAIVEGVSKKAVDRLENAMLGTQKKFNLSRKQLNENLRTNYRPDGFVFTPAALRKFAKSFYGITLSNQGDEFGLARELLTKLGSGIFSLVAQMDAVEPDKQHADGLRAHYMSYKAADLKKILTKNNVKGRSKLTKKADMIEAIIKLHNPILK